MDEIRGEIERERSKKHPECGVDLGQITWRAKVDHRSHCQVMFTRPDLTGVEMIQRPAMADEI
jgi:hypothetical protein